jgi:pimeloyl-ACP methyl ester carboxylesterase
MTVWTAPVVACCAALTAVLAGCEPGPSNPGPGGADTGSADAASWVAKRVDVGGHELNIICKGSGSPTIVFENGMDSTLGTWFRSDVANAFPSVRTCAYDRVNVGNSDRVPARHTGKDSVQDLRTLLDGAAVPAPYLLVGHSFGGLLAAMFAGTYPTDVVGLVLLDPTPPNGGDLDLLPERQRAAAVADLENKAEKVDFFVTLDQAKGLMPRIPNIPVLARSATAVGAGC